MRRSLSCGNPDEEIPTRLPGDFSDDESDEESAGADGAEDDESEGRRVGRPAGPAKWYRSVPQRAICMLCGKPCGGKELSVTCPMHSKDPHEPTTHDCRLTHPPEPNAPNLRDNACIILAGYPSRCEVEWCHKRLWCFRDYRFAHPACLGPTAKLPGCIEGCGRPHDRGSTRCTPCRRAHFRDEARLRQSRHRARKSGIAMKKPRNRA
jgi:hypothetical protein